MTASRGEELRLFVACELPAAAREALRCIQDELRARGAGGLRWVRPEGIHLTLKFLGSVASPRLPEIEGALAGAISGPLSLSLRLGRVGSFGGRQRLRVVWVGLEGDVEALAALAESVEGALGPLGFPRENRPFAPHLTLARVPDGAPVPERERLAALLEGFRLPPLPPLTVKAVSLMQSFLEPGGARYLCLASYPA